MKKVIIFSLAFAMTFSMSGTAALADASTFVNNNVNLGTSLTAGSGDNTAPIIKAKWEMKRAIDIDRNGNVVNMDDFDISYVDLDDNVLEPYTQLNPTGEFETDVPYTICAVVTDGFTNSTGNDNLAGVWVNEIHYPYDIAFHKGEFTDYYYGGQSGLPIPADEQNGGTNNKPDYGKSGCGDLVNSSEIRMEQLNQGAGDELFCDNVRMYGNDNLTYYYDEYDANEICTELAQEEAYVYCAPADLWYEDPAGEYTVRIKAQNISTSADLDFEVNTFDYVAMGNFALDFDNINYGPVANLNQWYSEPGDVMFQNGDGAPTVRNLGNTRLYIGIEQDDMGFNPQVGDNNIHYRARVGHGETGQWDDYTMYDPNWGVSTAWLQDILDLSEDEKMDFSVMLEQWLSDDPNGHIIISHKDANFRECVAPAG
jgi:hypothetical protein